MTRPELKRALALALAAASLACGGEPPASNRDPDGGSTARIELGTGTASFIPLAPAADIELVHGPQGGYHLETAVRLFIAHPEALSLRYEAIRFPSRAPLGETVLAVTPARVVREGDHFVKTGDIVVITALSDPTNVVGEEIEIVAILLDRDGELARDRRVLRVVDERP